jgi:phosphate transport system ATP-binding protein
VAGNQNPSRPSSDETAPKTTRVRTEALRVQRREKALLNGITLDVHQNEVLAIIGPAGAGKTTFLRSLNRMNDLDPNLQVTGKVFVEGHPVYADDVDVALLRRRVGMVFSVPVTLPMSIYENLVYGLRLSGENKSRFQERVEAALKSAFLWEEVKDRLHLQARNLSGGQQQRLCLARTLILEPRVLLLDEPCSGLDPISTAKIEEALYALKSDLTIILVTNNVKQASRASDRTAFFFFGEMIELQPTAALFVAPKDPRTSEYITGRFG